MNSVPAGVWSRSRFTFLLVAFLLLLVAIPVANIVSHPVTAKAIINILFLTLLVVGGLSTGRRASSRYVVVSLAAVAALLRFWAYISASSVAEAGAYVTALAILGTVAVLTIRELLTGDAVTYDKLSASLCAYGILAIFWAAAFSLLEVLQPGAFQYLSAADSAQGMQFGFGQSTQALYFSLVTITTLGYGDIVPTSDMARLMAATEAFTGQAYIAILVARLVGLHIASVSNSARN